MRFSIMKLKPYLISVGIALGVGGLAAFLTHGNIRLYAVLNKPPARPSCLSFPDRMDDFVYPDGDWQRPHLFTEIIILL